MNIITRTEIVKNYLRQNVVTNLMNCGFQPILANTNTFICSLHLDIGVKETYYVFLFNDLDNITKLGKGFLEGNTIKLEEIKLEWLNGINKNKGWEKNEKV